MNKILFPLALVLFTLNVSAQKIDSFSIKVLPYFPLKKKLTYHVVSKCINDVKNADCKHLEYDLHIEFLHKLGKIYNYNINVKNTKGNRSSINNIGKFTFEISTDVDGNFLDLTNWEFIRFEFLQYTDFKNKNEIVRVLKHLTEQLFFLYGKEVSLHDEKKYIAPIILNQDISLDGESTLKIIEKENDRILIKSHDVPSFENDLEDLKITKAEIAKSFLYDFKNQLLIYSETESKIYNGPYALRFTRRIELLEK